MIAELSITPMCKTEDTAPYLASVIDKIDKSGLNYQVTAVGTIIETDDMNKLFATIQDCHKLILSNCEKVQTDIRIEEHMGSQKMLKNRVSEVENILGKRIKH